MSLTVHNNRENNNDFEHLDIEESEIDKGFEMRAISGFQIKNCNILIDSFSIKLTEEEKKIIKEEILEFYKKKPNNSTYSYHKKFSLNKENKTYNCEILCVIKKIDDEKADIKYGMKEIEISRISEVNEKNESNCWKIIRDFFSFCE